MPKQSLASFVVLWMLSCVVGMPISAVGEEKQFEFQIVLHEEVEDETTFTVDGEKVKTSVRDLAQSCYKRHLKEGRINLFKLRVLAPLTDERIRKILSIFEDEKMYAQQVVVVRDGKEADFKIR